ncbi:Maf family protein [Cucumibacter marinus]|uniref:Maf family protein n=1 Tax=Cucumibacter marinus TaxID=1121252 RepID=UPI0004242B43|nr:Maf family protein [Cucumibacter marinus]
MSAKPLLILASKSRTRLDLLAGAGLTATPVPADIDERAIEDRMGAAAPRDHAIALAEAKALAVSQMRPGTTVIGADQVLDCDGERFHKPENRQQAARNLEKLRGRTHRLTAAAALAADNQILWSASAEARLTMRDFTPQDRDTVLDLEGDAILSSVGAYRLEGPSIRLFEAIDGDYFTILGLPLLPLLAALRHHAPRIMQTGASPKKVSTS